MTTTTASQGVLAGRVALVTGAASGIGRAAAELFAAQGAAVVAADVSDAGEETVAAITEAGGRATFVRGDVSVEAEVEAMVQAAESVYGGLDAAFNNAGIGGLPMVPTEELDSDSWERMMAINLRGVWLCMKHELAVMVPRGRGTIVNTSSVAGLVGTSQAAAYTAAKHGVVGLTRAAAVEHGRNGIRVNAIAPGFTRTAMVEDAVRGARLRHRLARRGRSPGTHGGAGGDGGGGAVADVAGVELRHGSRARGRRRLHRAMSSPAISTTHLGPKGACLMQFDFGQPTDGIFQTAFVVEDLDAAIEQFSARLRVGPWTTVRDVGPQGARYRGEPAQATLHVGFGFAGHMVIRADPAGRRSRPRCTAT